MNYEVEQKFRVSDLRAVESQLAAMGVEIRPAQTEADLYYAHPSRDFSRTDEALRIRRRGDRAWITYKGPKIDALTKTRRELDIELGQTPADDWAQLWLALGFRPVAEVRKSRRKAFVDRQGWRVEVSLDDVEQVGTFVELEVIADQSQLDAARACLAQLAAELGLNDGERRSYLELLLAK